MKNIVCQKKLGLLGIPIILYANILLGQIAGTEYTTPSLAPYYYKGNDNLYRLWIPDGVTKIRGIILTPNYNSDKKIYTDQSLGYHVLAKQLDFALMMYWVFYNSKRTQIADELFNETLPTLAKLSDHPEIAHACLIPIGLSWGGDSACFLTKTVPNRIIGYLPLHSARDVSEVPATIGVPSLQEVADRDGFIPTHSQVDSIDDETYVQRAKHALIAGYIQPNCGHADVKNPELMQFWIKIISALRLPVVIPDGALPTLNVIDESRGWLGRLDYHRTHKPDGTTFDRLAVDDTEIFTFDDYPYDKGTAHWLPTEEFAIAWQYYIEHATIPAEYLKWVKPASALCELGNRTID